MQKIHWEVLLADRSEGNKEGKVGQRMKLTHNAIVSEASVDSTESSRTRMTLQSCLKLRQWS